MQRLSAVKKNCQTSFVKLVKSQLSDQIEISQFIDQVELQFLLQTRQLGCLGAYTNTTKWGGDEVIPKLGGRSKRKGDKEQEEEQSTSKKQRGEKESEEEPEVGGVQVFQSAQMKSEPIL